MRITGPGIWGPPKDHAAAVAVLRRVRDLGIDFIDTADSYGPEISERLIAEVLHPYGDLFIATKGGLIRPGPDHWVPCGRPEYLRQQVHVSLRRLKVERIDLWQLHRVDPAVPRDEQFAVIAQMQKEGLIAHAGLSEVGVDDIKAAGKHFKVATVQNLYNLGDRKAKPCSSIAKRKVSGLFRGFRLQRAGWLAPARSLPRSPRATRHPRDRSPLPGF